MAYRDPAVRLQRDRERFHRRTAERREAGLCVKCGKQPPAPDRTVCDPCAGKRNKASRARDTRLRAEGKPRRDPARARSSERRRYRRQVDARCEAGRCTRCGQAPAVPERSMCEGCAAKRRASDRARYEAGKEAGLAYGGADADVKRRAARAASKRRQQARHAAGLCIRCGKRPPVQGETTCGPCREARQAAERKQYTERRAAGLCTRCGGPAFDGLSRCGPCAAIDDASRSPEQKNAASRPEVRGAQGQGRLHELRRPCAGRQPVCSLCEAFVRGVGLFPGHAALPAQLRRVPARERRMPRHLRRRDGGRRLPRLREAVQGPGRNRRRCQPDGLLGRHGNEPSAGTRERKSKAVAGRTPGRVEGAGPAAGCQGVENGDARCSNSTMTPTTTPRATATSSPRPGSIPEPSAKSSARRGDAE